MHENDHTKSLYFVSLELLLAFSCLHLAKLALNSQITFEVYPLMYNVSLNCNDVEKNFTDVMIFRQVLKCDQNLSPLTIQSSTFMDLQMLSV